jgi:hypothetical protein
LHQLIRHRADVNLADISGFRYTIHYTLYTHALYTHALMHMLYAASTDSVRCTSPVSTDIWSAHGP